MHLNVLGMAIDTWRRFKAPHVENLLRKIVSGRLIVGGSGSEPDNAASFLRPRATARPVVGGLVVHARTTFGPDGTPPHLYFTEALCDNGPEQATIMTFLIPRDTPGLIIKDDWHTMGMRSTASNSTELKEAFVPESAVILQRPVLTRGGVINTFIRAPFSIGA